MAANLYQIKFTHGNNGFILGECPWSLLYRGGVTLH